MIAVYVVAALFLGWLVVILYRVRQMALACKGAGAVGGDGTGTVASGPVISLDGVDLNRAFRSAGGCAARELKVKNVESSSDTLVVKAAGFDAACSKNSCSNSCGSDECKSSSNGDAWLCRLEVLMQDQADSVEGFVHRLAAVLRCRPGLRLVLVDGGSSDETGLILERIARRYNMEFQCFAGTTGSGIARGPVRCLDLRGLSSGDLLKLDLSAMESGYRGRGYSNI